jgi:hypothetical protein
METRAKDKQWLKGRDKYVSGYCNSFNKKPAHEGEKPRSPSGKPLKTCPMWDSCPCECHYKIDKMYESIGQPRVVEMPNPEYIPEKSPFVMPEDPIPDDPSIPLHDAGVNGHPITESPAAANVATPTHASLPPTPTGRRHRGQLEYEVLEVCTRWVAGEFDEANCIPKFVAATIAHEQGIPTPSTGAVQAVWDRWEKLGIATQAKKPARFTGWDGDFDGTATALTKLKASRRRQEKSAKSQAARGFR